jgi:hypothetical protein
MWYSAHIIMSVRFADPQDQTTYPVWENVVLIKAPTEDAAWQRAEEVGRGDETDGTDGFQWKGKPARWVFAGVRKVIECRSSAPDDQPIDGAEVSYSQIVLPDKEALTKLVNGRPVTVYYEE